MIHVLKMFLIGEKTTQFSWEFKYDLFHSRISNSENTETETKDRSHLILFFID